MNIMKALAVATALTMAPMVSNAFADDKIIVQKFYDFLSNPSSEQHAEKIRTVVAENWKSIGDYSGRTKSLEKFIGQVGGFGKLIPDLNWATEEILQD